MFGLVCFFHSCFTFPSGLRLNMCMTCLVPAIAWKTRPNAWLKLRPMQAKSTMTKWIESPTSTEESNNYSLIIAGSMELRLKAKSGGICKPHLYALTLSITYPIIWLWTLCLPPFCPLEPCFSSVLALSEACTPYESWSKFPYPCGCLQGVIGPL